MFLAETRKTPSVHPAENEYLIHFRAPGGGRLAGPLFPYAVTTQTVTRYQFNATMAKVGHGNYFYKTNVPPSNAMVL